MSPLMHKEQKVVRWNAHALSLIQVSGIQLIIWPRVGRRDGVWDKFALVGGGEEKVNTNVGPSN